MCQDIVPSRRSSCDRAWSSREGSRVNDRKSSPSSVITETSNPSTRTSTRVPISPRPIPMWCRRESCRRVTTPVMSTLSRRSLNRPGTGRARFEGSALGRAARASAGVRGVGWWPSPPASLVVGVAGRAPGSNADQKAPRAFTRGSHAECGRRRATTSGARRRTRRSACGRRPRTVRGSRHWRAFPPPAPPGQLARGRIVRKA